MTLDIMPFRIFARTTELYSDVCSVAYDTPDTTILIRHSTSKPVTYCKEPYMSYTGRITRGRKQHEIFHSYSLLSFIIRN